MDMGTDVKRRVVIKVGGNFLTDDDKLRAFLRQIRKVQEAWHVVLVHGGGPQASDVSRRLGHRPRKVAGRRITDEATLEVVKMTYAGVLQTDLVATARREGIPAVGLTGVDGGLIEAERRLPLTIEGEEVDFGWVGEIREVRTAILDVLVSHGFVPIISPLAGNDRGEVFNINADTLAASLAVAWQAHMLLFVLETGGVLYDVTLPETRMEELSEEDYHRGSQEGWIHTGMHPKLQAGFHALHGGVEEVVIAAASSLYEVAAGKGAGTRLRRS